ncbi:unnamed protein product [Paramecium octaurelia]|uniref:Transmembrane protein n=1 Tax=Paramecium octaurelia TaxID=43137 RepID=A0A8S1WRL5_PAROT|nr:unnamed protein product [Paramecium octaurelia]
MQIYFYKLSSSESVFFLILLSLSTPILILNTHHSININIQQNNSPIKHLVKPFSFELPQSEQFNPLLLDNLNQNYIYTHLQFLAYGLIWANSQELCSIYFHFKYNEKYSISIFQENSREGSISLRISKLNQKWVEVEIKEIIQVFRNQQELLVKLKEIKIIFGQGICYYRELQFSTKAKKVKEQAVKIEYPNDMIIINVVSQNENYSNILIIYKLKNKRLISLIQRT